MPGRWWRCTAQTHPARPYSWSARALATLEPTCAVGTWHRGVRGCTEASLQCFSTWLLVGKSHQRQQIASSSSGARSTDFGPSAARMPNRAECNLHGTERWRDRISHIIMGRLRMGLKLRLPLVCLSAINTLRKSSQDHLRGRMLYRQKTRQIVLRGEKIAGPSTGDALS